MHAHIGANKIPQKGGSIGHMLMSFFRVEKTVRGSKTNICCMWSVWLLAMMSREVAGETLVMRALAREGDEGK